MASVETNGITIEYEVAGHGDPLVLQASRAGDHGKAFSRQSPNCGGADAGAAAGDDRDLGAGYYGAHGLLGEGSDFNASARAVSSRRTRPHRPPVGEMPQCER